MRSGDSPERRAGAVGLVRRSVQDPVLLVLVAILLVGLALRVVFFFGLVKVDPFTYADAAISIARWQPVYDSELTGDVYYTQYIRLTLIVPAAALYKLFGVGDLTSVAFPLALSLAMPVMGWWFMRRALGERPALCAAALLALFPLYVVNSTQFLPDIVQAAFAALAMVTFLRALIFDDLPPRNRAWLYFTAGASLALAFYSRGTAIALLPPLGLILLLHWRPFDWTPLSAAAGGFAVLVVFQALMMALGAEPLEDFRVLYGLGSGSSFKLGTGYLETLFEDRRFWPYTWIAVASAVAWAYRDRRKLVRSPLAALFILVVGQYVYFEYFMSLPGTPGWWKEPRYVLSLAFPVLLIAGAGIGMAFDWLAKQSRSLEIGAGGLGAITLVAASVYGAHEEYDFYQAEGNRWDAQPRAVAEFLRANRGTDTYISNDDFARPLSFHMGGGGTFYERAVSGEGQLHNRYGADGFESLVTPGSYVVVVPREDWWPELTAPAPHWTLVSGGAGEAAVYEVAEPSAEDIAVRVDANEDAREFGIESVGLGTPWLLPGHHAAIELTFSEQPDEPVFDMRLVCDGVGGAPTELSVPDGAAVLRADLYLRPPVGVAAGDECSIHASGRELIDVAIPLVEISQSEALPSPNWSTYSDPGFSAVIGIIAPGTPKLRIPVPELEPGEYWVEVRLYDYGEGIGEIEGTLNEAIATTTWGGSGTGPGPTTARLHFASAGAGAELELRFGGEQEAVLVDAFVISSVEPPTSGR